MWLKIKTTRSQKRKSKSKLKAIPQMLVPKARFEIKRERLKPALVFVLQ